MTDNLHGNVRLMDSGNTPAAHERETQSRLVV